MNILLLNKGYVKLNNKTITDKLYTIVKAGASTSALLFYTDQQEVEIYIGNNTDIELEAEGLNCSHYKRDDSFLSYLRKNNKFTQSPIQQGSKYYDIEKVIQGDKTIACTVRSVHERHGKLMPNIITFTMETDLINSKTKYPKALKWVTDRAAAFAKILESEGMKVDSEFILNSFIYALGDDIRLQRFIDADRGQQTITKAMLA